MRAHTPILLVASLVAAAFAGCLSADTEGEPTISRVHTLTLSPETTQRAEAAGDDPMAALRELLTTDIVVRVLEAGDYTLEYTDASGNPQTHAITGATPGTPVTVAGADPISPVVLKRGDATISVRGGISADWWHVGDMPLGFNMTAGSKARYDFASSVREALTLTDLDVEEQGISIDDLRFDLRLPMEGAVSWELQPDTGEGAPLLFTGELGIPAGTGDLATVEVIATQNGVTGTAGFVAGVEEARASMSGKLWVKDGQPVAAQFLGGQATAVPRATAWADGFFADLAGGEEGGFSCAGKSKADACQPAELESFDEDIPSEDKETFDAADFPRAEDDEAREALTLIQRLFAQDIMAGDKATVIATADSASITGNDPSAPRGDFLMTFTIEAVSTEQVTVPAGTFQALKILEEARFRLNVESFDGPDGAAMVTAFNLDETVARTTFWLDATTYQPLKMEATTPFDAEAMMKSMLNAVAPSAWDEIGGKPIDDSQWSFTAVGESSYEATEIQPGAHFSALVGLGLAHGLTGTMGAAPLSMWTTGFGAPATGFGEEYARPVEPARSLSMASNGPAEGGLKSFTIASASPRMMWGDLYLTIDGEESYLEWSFEGCSAPTDGFAACEGERSLGYDDPVVAGQVLTVVAEPGQTMRVIDPYSNSVILSLTIS